MLTIKVEAGAGDDIRDLIEEMCILASRMGCIVYTKLNDVTTMAKPGADPCDLYKRWEAELASKRQHKICCGHPVAIPRDKEWDRPAVDKDGGRG